MNKQWDVLEIWQAWLQNRWVWKFDDMWAWMNQLSTDAKYIRWVQADASLRMARLVGRSIITLAQIFFSHADRILPPDYLMPGIGTTGQVVPVRMECPSPLEIWILQLIGWDACETSVSVLCSPKIQYLYPYILLRAMNVHRHIVSSCSVYGGLYLVYRKLRFLLLLFVF